MKIERILWYVQLIGFSVFLSRFAGKVKIAQLCTFQSTQTTGNAPKKKRKIDTVKGKSFILTVNDTFTLN